MKSRPTKMEIVLKEAINGKGSCLCWALSGIRKSWVVFMMHTGNMVKIGKRWLLQCETDQLIWWRHFTP
nr:hypothetical protein Iba_chr14dCG14720 [Ipomoea batatas]